MTRLPLAAGLCAALLSSGCATEPLGPTARVMPASGKPFQVFAQDQSLCKSFADGEVGGSSTTSNLKQLGTAAISTALGAGLGAALAHHAHGGASGGAGPGGAIGAVAGALMGGRGSGVDQRNLQGRYDLAYTQCMYARGNQVAGISSAPVRPGAPQTVATAPSQGGFPGLAGLNPLGMGGTPFGRW